MKNKPKKQAMIEIDEAHFVIKIEGAAEYPATLDFGGQLDGMNTVEAGDLLTELAVRYLSRYELVAIVPVKTETFTGLGNTAR